VGTEVTELQLITAADGGQGSRLPPESKVGGGGADDGLTEAVDGRDLPATQAGGDMETEHSPSSRRNPSCTRSPPAVIAGAVAP
jgi:hypothetical protein